MHTLRLMRNSKLINLTDLCSNVTLSSHIDALATELSFDIAYQAISLVAGDQIVFANETKIINHYIVISTSTSSRNIMSVRAYDRAWYMNKNQTIIQFKNASATSAITKLLDKYNVKHSIAKMNTNIKQIYKSEAVSDIILDILEQVKQETGQNYRMEMDRDTLVIYKESERIINPYIRLSDNTNLFPVTKTISNPSMEKSIEDMKNRVIVANSGDDSTDVYTTLSDDTSIATYGLLTEVVKVDKNNKAQARNIAKTTLTDLNKINESVSCEMIGHDDVIAGRILELNESTIDMVGKYLILSATHSINNSIHKVSLELKKVT